MLWRYVLMCLIFGTTFLTIKIGLDQGMPPFFFAAMRFFIAGALLLLYFGWRKQWPKLSFKQYGEIALVGILMTTVPYAALFWSEQYIASGVAALLVATAPIFTTLLGVFTGQMRFRWFLAAGLVLSIGGTAWIVSTGSPSAGADGSPWASRLVIVAAELFYAIGAVRSKKVMRYITPFAFNGFQMFFASLALFVLSFCTEQPFAATYSVGSIVSLLYLALIASLLALGLFYWLVKETNPTFPSTWTYVAPILALLVGALFLGEPITVRNICGCVLVVAGIVLLNWQTWQQMWQKRAERNSTAL